MANQNLNSNQNQSTSAIGSFVSEIQKMVKDELLESVNACKVEGASPEAICTTRAAAFSQRLADRIFKIALREKLNVLFEYEKHYLDLVKEYKEEIKFAAALQEDLRKERSKFFSETLKEVSTTLQSTPMDKEVSAMWMRQLVESYTSSLDLSSDLAKEHALDKLGDLTEQVRKSVEQDNNK